jgi:probable HAF family extracellular repeat protein
MKKLIALLALSLLFATSLLAKNQYKVYSFPSGYIVTAINSSGEVVGSLNNQPFVWTRSGGFQFLGNFGGGSSSFPNAINDSGEVAGASILPSGVTHAFLWTASTGMIDLGSILGGQSFASSINNNGQIAGATSSPDGTVTHAFFWSQATGAIDLGTSSGFSLSQPSALNNNGEVTGVEWNQNQPTSLFTWTSSAGIQLLPTLGGPTNAALSINDSGQIAGYTQSVAGYLYAYLWQADGTALDLGDLPGDSQALAVWVNAAGHVVGRSLHFHSGYTENRIFFWTPDSGMIDIGAVATPNTIASTLNNRDQIVGNDHGNGAAGGAYLWSPTLGLVKIAGSGIEPLSAALNEAGQFLAVKGYAPTATYQLYTPVMQVGLGSSQNPATLGQTVTFTANVSAIVGLPPDGEQVAFYDGSKLLGSAPLSSGIATFTTSTLSAGTHSILASYVGDINYEPNKSSRLKQLVNP